MQFRLLTAVIVFMGSYLPLSLILLVQDLDYGRFGTPMCWPLSAGRCELPLHDAAFAIAMFTLTLVCFLITLGVLALIEPKQDVQILGAKYIPTDLMNYTLPYIVSFMSVDYHETGKFMGFAVFLGWMFWISYRSGQIILNPILIALSWRLYEVDYVFTGSPTQISGWALAKGPLLPGAYKQSQLQDIQIIKP